MPTSRALTPLFAVAAGLALADVSLGVKPAPTVRLRNGVEMPLMALGVWQYNDTETEAALGAAFQVGFRMVDTAYDYRNQVGVGKAVAAAKLPRKKIFVETKVPGCGLDPAVLPGACYEDTKKVLEEDLRQLNMSYVDLVIIHFPPIGALVPRTCAFTCGEISNQWRAMEEFYKAGKARAIGVSNYCPSCFHCLEKQGVDVYPMVNQVSYHIGMGADPAGFRSFADSRGVVLQAYSPLGNRLTGINPKPNPEILSGNFTTTLGKAHNKSTIAVALKYLVQHGVPTITKSSNPAHLADDLDLWSWNLTASELKAADEFRLAGSPSFACNAVTDELVV